MSSLEVSQLTCSRGSQSTCSQVSRLTFCKGFELNCQCALNAKLRISRTDRNKFRPFYSCSKTDFDDQCKFFQWADEQYPSGDKHLDEMNELSLECRLPQQRIDLILQKHDAESAAWNRERMEMTTRLSSTLAELEQMKTGIEKLDNSDSIPFYDDRVCSSNDNEDDAKAKFSKRAALAEMLVQSTMDDLHLLTALPWEEWPYGLVKGLRAPGNMILCISWKEGDLHEVGLWSNDRQNTVKKRL